MSDFVRKPLAVRLNKKNFVSRLERLERNAGARPSSTVGSLQEIGDSAFGDGGGLFDPGGFILMADEFPSQQYIQWVDKSTLALLAKLIGFYVSGISSGTYLIGQERDASHYGVAGLAVQGHDQELGEYEALFQIDSNGLSPRVFVEQAVGAVTRRSYLPAAGWLPFAYMPGGSNLLDWSAASVALPANGGCRACPVFLSAPMLLQSVTIWNGNAATQRTWNWGLYQQFTNTGDSAENTLTRVASGNAVETFTPGAQSARTITAASAPSAGDAPIYLGSGLYWCVIQNQHATNTFALGNAASVTNLGHISIEKTITNPMGSTLDFVAATWVTAPGVSGVRLDGRVFGQTTLF